MWHDVDVSVDARDQLLTRVLTHVATSGMSGSLRETAAAVGTSHRMLLYHFESRAGLNAAIVERMESIQRDALESMAAEAAGPVDLVRRQWSELTTPEVLPFVRLFFEALALAAAGAPGTEGFLTRLTEPWIDVGMAIAEKMGTSVTPAELRAGIAVMRGLLADVLAGCPVDVAGAALDAYLAKWE
jgi:AcrR family transcriptional regulator